MYVAGRGDTTEAGDTPSSRDGRSTCNSGSGSLHWLDLVLSLVPSNVMTAPVYTLCHYCQVSWHMVTVPNKVGQGKGRESWRR